MALTREIVSFLDDLLDYAHRERWAVLDCIACLACEMICPVDAIRVVQLAPA